MIYKRQPIQHKLPSNWQDTDAESNFNIVNFKGLQSYDNPLLAELQSTYNCKNVYVDENGSLTVRPRLISRQEFLEEFGDVLKMFDDYETGNEFIVHIVDYTMYLTARLGPYKLDRLQITDANVVMQLSPDKIPYFLVNIQNHLRLYKFINDNFEIVTGDTLLSNSEANDFSQYNILNDTVKYHDYIIPEKYPVINTYTENDIVKTESLKYQSIYLTQHGELVNANLTINTNPLETFILIDGYVSFRQKDIPINIMIPRHYPEMYVPDSDPSDNSFNIWFTTYDNELYLHWDAAYINAYDIEIIYAGYFNCSVQIMTTKCIRHKYEATNQKAWEIHSVDLSPASPDILLLNYRHGYDKYYYKYISDSKALNEYTLATLKADIESIDAFSTYLLNSAILIAYSTGEIKLRTLYNAETNITFESYVNPRVTTIDDSAVIYSGAYDGDERLIQIITSSGAVLKNIVIPNYKVFLNVQAIVDNDIIGRISSEQSSTLLSNHFFEIKSDGLYVYEPTVINKNMYKTANILNTVYPYKTKFVTRDKTKIPVLLDISEKPITAFYLDGIHWFITEHNVFGTGAGSDGQLTLEYWDPRKYFKITESITGAMRVSDTSFWIFHNSGAYLIYKSNSLYYPDEDGVGIYLWQITNTAKSKGCDFENAVITLPVTSYISTVTIDDICSVQMRENIQSDDRILVPMTTQLQKLTADLLLEAESVLLCNYKYLTLYCINMPNANACALVYDNAQNNWWYWEFPILKVLQVLNSEDNVRLLCKTSDTKTQVLSFSEDYFLHKQGLISTAVYADMLGNYTDFMQIDWFWTSAIQIFNALNYRKQLLYTTFLLHDNNLKTGNSIAEQEQNFSYNFDIYSKQHLSSKHSSAERKVTRAEHMTYRTNIGSFTYLQLTLKNQNTSSDDLSDKLEVMTKPKFTGISFKYRTLSGGLT